MDDHVAVRLSRSRSGTTVAVDGDDDSDVVVDATSSVTWGTE